MTEDTAGTGDRINLQPVKLFTTRHIWLWGHNPGPGGECYPHHVAFMAEADRETAESIAGFLQVEAIKT